MSVRKGLVASALSFALLTGTVQPALAQPAASIAAGAHVVDPQGGEVGTISSVDGGFVVLRTDRHEMRLSVTSFTPHEGHLLFGMTRAEANAAADAAVAQAQQSIAVGAMVRDSAGGTVGTITELDAEFATLRVGEILVKFPRSGMAGTPTGPVIGMTAAELQAQASAGSQ